MSRLAVELEVFRLLLASIAEEMGAALMRSALSPNIKERRDFSCALFDGRGTLIAQGEHLPVHLGAMPASVRAALAALRFDPGDAVLLNDPYHGGSHLPDLTLIHPVFAGGEAVRPLPTGSAAQAEAPDAPAFFVASRAHHADVGGMSPGSMPLSREIFQEGLRIPPIKLEAGGRPREDIWRLLLANVRTPEERRGDLEAQLGANRRGVERLRELCGRFGRARVTAWGEALVAYTARRVEERLRAIGPGEATFTDYLDDDGAGGTDLAIAVSLRISPPGRLSVDFAGTAPVCRGSLNAPPAVAVSAVAYLVRCLLEDEVPSNDGLLLPVSIAIPPGCLLDPRPPAAVAGGNVETSQRVVDALFGAMAQLVPELPAASSGTMTNLTVGGWDARRGRPFAYYETVAGGLGGAPGRPGPSATHAHMTNTLNTPVEALEHAYPLRIRRYAVRQGTGGAGRWPGGDGVVRELEALAEVEATVLAERHQHAPWGRARGEPGAVGRLTVVRAGANVAEPLPGKCSVRLRRGDRLIVETPGGGGWGPVGA